jgi:hypothetical protein
VGREAAVFNLIDDLFVPSRRHTEDERNRLELSRDDESSSDPARGPIDLDSGAVIIRSRHRDRVESDDGDSEAPGQPPGVTQP